MWKRCRSLAAAIGLAGSPVAGADILELELGSFLFGHGTDDYEYVGDYAAFMGSDVEGDPIEKTVATIDLGAVLAAFDMSAIAWITISDPGTNAYYTNPGADIDLFTVSGLPEGVGVEYGYDGINPLYTDMSSAELAQEVAEVDFTTGAGDASDLFVSLACEGSLTMSFLDWPDSGGGGDDPGDDSGSGDSGPGDDPGDDSGGDPDTDDGADWEPGDILDLPGLGGDSPIGGEVAVPSIDPDALFLRFNEIAPTAEWVTISIGLLASSHHVVVPGPFTITALPVAVGLMRRRRRR